jgi:hypothetical protein
MMAAEKSFRKGGVAFVRPWLLGIGPDPFVNAAAMMQAFFRMRIFSVMRAF